MDGKKLFLFDKKSIYNLIRVWKYHGWNMFLTPWYMRNFKNISRRSVVNIKTKLGNTTGKNGIGVGAGAIG